MARRWLLAICMGVSASITVGCDPGTIRAVGDPGGVYQPDQGCTLFPGAPICPARGDAQPQLRFEAETDPGLAVDTTETTPGNLSNLRVTCVRSYCGSGSLTAHADLQWDNNASDPRRMGSLVHAFDPPLDLMGRTISLAVYVEAVTLPLNAQVGVIFDYWRWVGWAPLAPGWNRIDGVVSPANPLTKIDPAVTAIPVSAIRIDVYVPVADASGAQGAWTGEIFVDDVSW